MRILDRSGYVGPSLYARFPAIRLELDRGELEAWPTGRLGPGFPRGYTGGYEDVERDEGIGAGELALRLLSSLLPPQLRPADSVPAEWSWPEARDQFIRFAQRRALGPSTASLVRAAEARGIPWLRLNDQSLVQLGHGKYQQRLQATVTGRTPHISVELASDKEETNKILAGLGLPVPQQLLLQSETQTVRAAQPIGFPVVTKPYNGNHGRGISIRLTSDEEVAHGFTVAREHSRSVIVETFLEGDDHRLLVVNGELVAATRRTPGP